MDDEMKQGSRAVVESLANHQVEYVFGFQEQKSMGCLMS